MPLSVKGMFISMFLLVIIIPYIVNNTQTIIHFAQENQNQKVSLLQALGSKVGDQNYLGELDINKDKIIDYQDVKSFLPNNNIIMAENKYVTRPNEANSDGQIQPPVSIGYLVEFQDPPLISYFDNNALAQDLTHENVLSATSDTPDQVEKKIDPATREFFLKKHEEAKNDVLSRISSQQNIGIFNKLLNKQTPSSQDKLKVTGEFTNLINGVALDINDQQAQELKKSPYVKRIAPNYQVKISLAQSVPLIKVPDVWNSISLKDSQGRSITGKGVKVGIIDTGVDYTHPDLGGCFGAGCKVIDGYDFKNSDNDPRDDNGHGTHVAAIVAGNGVLKGVAPDAQVVAYKVLDQYGSGDMGGVIAAIDRSFDPNQDGIFSDHLDVISLSLGVSCGSYTSDCGPDDMTSQAINMAVDNGVIAVIAAGNNGVYGPSTILSPGVAKKAITVAAADKSDQMASFSSQGPVSWSGGNMMKPDVTAPGVNICAALSSVHQSNFDPYKCLDQNHMSISGTSMATPHIAGVAALLKQLHKEWNPLEIKMAIKNTGKDLNVEPAKQGLGRVDALAANGLSENPPVIYLILSSAQVKGVINIPGSITSTNFKSYKLEVGEGVNPVSWTVIKQSSSLPTGSFLMSNYDVSPLKDGSWTLKLTAENNSGVKSIEKVYMEVKNIEMTSPLPQDVVSKAFNVEGAISYSDFDHLTISYEKDGNWITDGVSLVNGGKAKSGILGSINIPSLTQAISSRVKLTVYRTNSTSVEKLTDVYIDPAIAENWPKRIPYQKCPHSGYLTCLPDSYIQSQLDSVTFDLDHDGSDDIIAVEQGMQTRIYAWRQDGSLLPGWPATINGLALELNHPAVADIDGDGLGEVIINFSKDAEFPWKSDLYVFKSNGQIMPGWPVKLNGFAAINAPVVADLNHDNKPEIIVQTNGIEKAYFYILNNNGQIMPGWPKEALGQLAHVGSQSKPTVAIGNFDNDPDLEFTDAFLISPVGTAYADTDSTIYTYNIDGSFVPGWPKTIREFILNNSPVTGDLNKDGKDDIVVAGEIGTYSGGLYAFDSSGVLLPGWPQLKNRDINNTPIIADFNDDGFLDVAASVEERGIRQTYVFNKDGILLPGWPQQDKFASQSLISTDLNSDNKPDLIGRTFYPDTPGAEGSFDAIWGLNGDGTPLNNFPKKLAWGFSSPVVFKNKDGNVSMSAGSESDVSLIPGQTKLYQYKLRGSVYVWNLPIAFKQPEWPMFHHDASRTGKFGVSALVSTPVPSSSPNPTPTSGMIGNWKFDESSWINDCATKSVIDSVGGNNGKSCPAGSGPATAVVGKSGNAVSLDGVDDRIKIDNASVLNPGNITVSAWVKLNSYSGLYPRIISKAGAYELVLYTFAGAEGRIEWNVYLPTQASVSIPSTAKIPLNTWTHVAASYNGSTLKIYINGIKIVEKTGFTGNIVSSTNPLILGGQDTGRFINSNLDDVRIYNQALTDAQIQQLAEVVPTPVISSTPASPLIGLWKFDESSWINDCATKSVIDSVGGNNGKSCPAGSGPSTPILGKLGNAVNLDGVDDRITIDNSSSINPQNITVSAWVKLNSYSGLYPRIISKAGAYELVMYTYSGAEGRLEWDVYLPNQTSLTTPSTAKIPLNIWTHIAATYDGTISRIYVNGVKISEKTGLSGNIALSTNPLIFGGQNTGRFINANIDDVRIFNRALTDFEIQQLFGVVPAPTSISTPTPTPLSPSPSPSPLPSPTPSPTPQSNGPDLIIEDVKFINTSVGSANDMDITIKNIGNVKAVSSDQVFPDIYVLIYITKPDGNSGGQWNTHISSVDPGASVVAQVRGAALYDQVGIYKYTFKADGFLGVAEINESNNTLQKDVTVH